MCKPKDRGLSSSHILGTSFFDSDSRRKEVQTKASISRESKLTAGTSMQFLDVDPTLPRAWEGCMAQHPNISWISCRVSVFAFQGQVLRPPWTPFSLGSGLWKDTCSWLMIVIILYNIWWKVFWYLINPDHTLKSLKWYKVQQYDTICWFDMSMLQFTKQPSSTLDIVYLPVELRQGKLRRLKRRLRYLRRSSPSDLMVMTVDVDWQPGFMGSNGCILHYFYNFNFLEGRPFPPCYPPRWFVPTSKHGKMSPCSLICSLVFRKTLAAFMKGRDAKRAEIPKCGTANNYSYLERSTKTLFNHFNLFLGEYFNWLPMLHMLCNFWGEDLLWEFVACSLWIGWISGKRPRWSCLQVMRRTAEVVVNIRYFPPEMCSTLMGVASVLPTHNPPRKTRKRLP